MADGSISIDFPFNLTLTLSSASHEALFLNLIIASCLKKALYKS
jgi:hypothetical protein